MLESYQICFSIPVEQRLLEAKGWPEFFEEIKQWDQKRAERLKADDGWLNLVGRTWLKPSEIDFGSAKDNDVLIGIKQSS
ncbi:MAG: hypothetical protein U5J96_18580 [Ignavibacteriaceae bacterium]|nr:hypothetical protein [Ignavibacteriaceae bacterium]